MLRALGSQHQPQPAALTSRLTTNASDSQSGASPFPLLPESRTWRTMAKKEKPTVKAGTIAIPMPKRSDFARVLKEAAKPRSIGTRRTKKKRPK
jgi:hypothetical protein